MGILTKAKARANAWLAPLNVRLDSLTADKAEVERWGKLEARGHFEKAVFPVLKSFKDCDPSPVLQEVAKHEKRFAEFSSAPKGGKDYSFDNEYFSSPDAEVLYAMVQLHKPERIIEVGSGNSTLLYRQAISDSQLNTRLFSIDPYPRREIAQHSDEVIEQRVEDLQDLKLFRDLKANDILFIDSSHEVKAGNDVLFLLLHVLPILQPGVLIHVHDIFLPFEYPRSWVVEWKWGWTEQYLVHALLQDSTRHEVLWAGHYLQRTLPGFTDHFVHWRGSSAKSLWLRKK